MAKQNWKGGVNLVSSALEDFVGPDVTDVTPLWTGSLREYNGKLYVLCRAGGPIADGALVKGNTAASTGPLSVIVTTGANQSCIGVNNTGQAIANNQYFWALRRGRGYVLSSAAHASGDALVSAAAGQGAGVANSGVGLGAQYPQGEVIVPAGGAASIANTILFACT